jgi:hypothetical protein
MLLWVLPVLSWCCLFSTSVCRICCGIFCSGDLVVIYFLVSVYCGRLLFLYQFWIIVLLGRVSQNWNCFLLVLKIPHSMSFLLLRFLSLFHVSLFYSFLGFTLEFVKVIFEFI